MCNLSADGKGRQTLDRWSDRDIIFIGPESDHWECLSVTHSLTNSCSVNLIDLTLACEDDNSKLVEVVSVAHVDDEKRVGNSLVQILKLIFRLDFEAEVWSLFCC